MCVLVSLHLRISLHGQTAHNTMDVFNVKLTLSTKFEITAKLSYTCRTNCLPAFAA